MGDTIVKLYQKQNFVIPEDILRTIRKNSLTLDEALLIIYFSHMKNHAMLDIEDIKTKFGMSELDIMQAFAHITEKNLIAIKLEKNRDNKMEEIIDLTPFYESIAMEIGDEAHKEKTLFIFNAFEQEMGRPLSSMETSLINNWLDRGISEELINAALKEAIFNGTFTLRYIDAIISEWNRKGLKSSSDVDVYLKKKRNSKPKKTDDLFDYNWLDEDE